jgi:hypothetical protein
MDLSDMSELIYLASPYSHPDKIIEQARFEIVCQVAAKMMAEGKYVLSPIAHTHPIALAGKLPGNWEYWEGYDRTLIKCCQKLIVVRISGWRESKGVQAEIKIAQELGIPVEYLDSAEYLGWPKGGLLDNPKI